jgi:4-amino-4-deoxy-L-arabinose transferase
VKKITLIMVVLFIVVYIASLGVRPLSIPDETRYAEIPREMIVSGDWVSPRLDGLRYFEKPVLGYWVNVLSMLLFGQNNFAVRLPAALSVGLAAVFIFLLVRRFAGPAPSGILAAAAFLTCAQVFGVGTFNVLDPLLTMLLTGAMVSFFFAAYGGPAGTWQWRYLAMFGLFCGLAFLTKGFLALVIPLLVIIPFLLWERRLAGFLKVCILPLLVAVAVLLPWAIAIHLRQPDFWRYFIVVEHIRRFTSPTSGQHPEPFWYFLPILLVGALPWTALLGCVFKGLRSADIRGPLIRFSLCWLILPFLFFSASSGKLATYILPCFPPLVILITIGLQSRIQNTAGGLCRAARAYAFVLILLAIGIAALQLLPLPPSISLFGHTIHLSRPYAADETQQWVWLLAAGAVSCVFLLLAAAAADSGRRLIFWCLAPLSIYFSIPHVLPEDLLAAKAPARQLAQNASKVSPETIVVSDKYLVAAACWYYKRTDVLILGNQGELAYGASQSDSMRPPLKSRDFAALVAGAAPGSSIVLIMGSLRFGDKLDSIPHPTSISEVDGIVFAQYKR